jgi:phosphoribosylformimino-5-aminoimidazole carboxamide ribotide isomerase
MTMEIYPAIDLQKGQGVRLSKGDFASTVVYAPDPVAQAQKFEKDGAVWLHVVDLDGAEAGEVRQTELIAKMTRETSLKIQAGGGIRQEEDVRKLLDAGVARVVVGSLAVEKPHRILGWFAKFGADRFVLALDVRLYEDGEAEVLTKGWKQASGLKLEQAADPFLNAGLQTVLCTDVSRDGLLQGPNLALYGKLRRLWPDLSLLASGGVSNLSDLTALAACGASGAIVGKAIYENRVDLASALAEVRNAG